jgi:hypothetical protein
VTARPTVGSRRHPARRGTLVPGVLLAAAAAVLALLGTPLGNASLLARITNSTNAAVSAGYFTCTAAVSDTKTLAGAAYFAYPFGESAGTTATDVSGSAHNGTYGSTGITYGVANPTVCPRDTKTVITLNGSTGYISGPNTKVTGPTVFSLEIWFNTTTKQGKLIGFGSSRTGSSTSFDRHLYIDTTGKLEFGVTYGSTKETIATPNAVTDGAWHYAVATLSTAGTALYLDGTLVDSNTTVTTATPTYTGYWRIGYDSTAGWTGSSTNYFFKGNLAWAAEYPYALSPAQVTAHYRAGT